MNNSLETLLPLMISRAFLGPSHSGPGMIRGRVYESVEKPFPPVLSLIGARKALDICQLAM